LSNKNIAVGATILVSMIAFITLLTETYMTFRGFDPVAIAAAIIVAVIGLVWFRKTIK
jgi:hypothetical protein